VYYYRYNSCCYPLSGVAVRIDYPLVVVAVVDYEYCYYEIDIDVALVAGDAVPIVAVLGYRLLD
jgi:hypothetical protein